MQREFPFEARTNDHFPALEAKKMSRPTATLDELLREPQRVAELLPETVRSLMAHCAALQSALAARLLSVDANGNGQPELSPEDRLLTVKQAAEKLGLSRDYIYRHAKALPFTVRIGRQVRFSNKGIERYLRQRLAR